MSIFIASLLDPLNANHMKLPNTLKKFVGNSQQIVSVRLTIFGGWPLKG